MALFRTSESSRLLRYNQMDCRYFGFSLFLGLLIHSTQVYANDAMEAFLDQRKTLLDQFALSEQQGNPKEVRRVAREANLLFLQAQEARLKEEIGAAELLENSTRHRGWERDAAKQTLVLKRETLRLVSELQKSPPVAAMRCLTDARSSAVSPRSLELLSAATTTYSKSGRSSHDSFFSTMPSASRSGHVPNPLEISTLIRENSIPSDVLRYREPIQLAAQAPAVNLNEAELKALEDLGGQRPVETPSEVDFSHRFSTPKLQPPRTALCAGFAISSDMESVLNVGIIGGKTVSADYTYTALVASEAIESGNSPLQSDVEGRIRNSGFCNLLGIQADPLAGVADIADSLRTLGRIPVCSTNDSEVSRISRNQYRVASFRSVSFPTERPSLNFVQQLLSQGITPMVVTSSEARTEQEDWLFPKVGGQYRHVVNLVGFGRSREPNCLDEVDYLIVRDSLGKNPIHYRVPAGPFLSQTLEMHKISSVSTDHLAKFNPFTK